MGDDRSTLDILLDQVQSDEAFGNGLASWVTKRGTPRAMVVIARGAMVDELMEALDAMADG